MAEETREASKLKGEERTCEFLLAEGILRLSQPFQPFCVSMMHF